MIATAGKQASVFACPGCQLYVSYSASEKCAFGKALEMERVIIPALYLFVGHRNLQHVEAECEKSFCLCYHTYCFPSHTSTKNAI